MSESMENCDKKIYAVSCFLNLYEKYIEDYDRIAFISFNHNYNVIFELTEKRLNRNRLHKAIIKMKDEKAFG